ncbi:hypothetical protein, partial [Bartonella sp. CB60]|uniref:hypothetical protein n=1 Tax=Bartonella sp. CB60 TaxID=3113619 RepID=UPI00300DC4FF
FSAFQLFSFSAFQLFSFSAFQLFSFSAFQLFSFSAFQLFSFSAFQRYPEQYLLASGAKQFHIFIFLIFGRITLFTDQNITVWHIF